MWILQQTPSELCLHIVLGPFHEEQLWQDLDENAVHPGRHSVGLRWPEMNIQHHDRHADTASDGEEEKSD